MTSTRFTAEFLMRIKKSWMKISIGAAVGGLLLLGYTLLKPVTYTSYATLFPLNSTIESSTSSLLSSLMGINESAKSFTNEASINIVELAKSRAIRREVALIQVPERGNRTIAQLLLEEHKVRTGLPGEASKIPLTDEQVVDRAVKILEDHLEAGINKNNSFEIKYTGTSPELVRAISYGFIDKISAFYINLKREKAKLDYDFATSKVDSLRDVMQAQDRKMVHLQKTTMFTNGSLEYQMPAENLIADKQLLRNQYATAVTNQQNASYILQKATPVVKILDRPDEPYKKRKRLPVFYFLFGCLLGGGLVTAISVTGVFTLYLREKVSSGLQV